MELINVITQMDCMVRMQNLAYRKMLLKYIVLVIAYN